MTKAIRQGIVGLLASFGPVAFAGEHRQRALVQRAGRSGTDRPSQWMMRQIHGIRPFASDDRDSSRIHWRDAGVHQNLTFPVQPDPVSGQHCWHQKVTVTHASPKDRYGDIFVDTNKAHEEYRRWLGLARQAPGPDRLRPLWMPRVYRPDPAMFYFDDK